MERRWTVAAALAAGLFVIYALGACRTIYVGDSGELVAAAATLGIPHPSGYPLYVLTGKLWTLLVPIGSIAFRMSLFSAFWASVACGGLYLVARRAGFMPSAAVFSALLLAFSPSFWSQANIQRVYSLNAFFLVLMTAAVLEWHARRDDRWLVAAALMAGLGASNHTFMGVAAFAVAAFAIVTEPAVLRRFGTLAACVGASVLGLLPYAYLPLRSRADPRLDWGNPETLDAFFAAVLRRDFWDRAWLESSADFIPVGADYLASLGSELFWAGTVLALIGAVAGFRRGWPVLFPLFVMAVNLWTIGVHGSRSDIFIWHRYYIPSYLMAALLAGYGWQWVLETWLTTKDTPRERLLRWAVVTVPLLLLIVGYRDFDRSRFRIAEDFSRTLLSTLPPGSHLSASDDNILFVLIYLHLVEGLRPDLDLIMQGVGDAELPALRFDPDTDPLFFTHHPNWDFPGLDLAATGLAFRVVRSSESRKPPEIPKWTLDGADDPRVPKDYLTSNLIGHFHYMLGLSFEQHDWPRAQAEFLRAQAAASENDVLFYNLGLIYRRNGLVERALAAFERSREINPRHIASNRPARAVDRIEETRREVERLREIERGLAGEMAGLVAGGAGYHRRVAEILDARGEPLAAHGHRLLAQESSGTTESR